MVFEFYYAFIAIPIIVLIPFAVKIVNQYERGVVFTLGKFSGILHPGFNLIIPFIQLESRIDVRTNVIAVPRQDTMTKDNVSVVVDAVIYYKVVDPKSVVVHVQNYEYATTQMAQTTLREVVGETTLDDLLVQREGISKKIQTLVDKATHSWGIKIDNVEIKDLQLPPDLIRIIAKEAEAEREKRAVVIKAQGELEAAKSLSKAAKDLSEVPGGLHIRMLQTINSLGNEKSITHVITTPSEFLGALLELIKKKH